MKLLPVLRNFKFGSDVAEHDTALARYFVETSAFFDMIGDEADVLLGAKGTGKTAIARTIIDPNVDIPALSDVDIVPAFNTQGSVMFRSLTNSEGLGEDAMRSAWMTYFIALVGNHLIDTYGDTLDVSQLRGALRSAGLLTQVDRPRSIWDSICTALGRTLRPSSVEGSMTFAPNGIPIILGKIDFEAEQLTLDPPSHEYDLEEVIDHEVQLLAALDRRCWVVLDRLDEAFQHDRDLERIALRGLLRAHLDLSSYGSRLRSKLFMRNDLLDRITSDSGFVNATHMRIQRIRWDTRTLEDLIAKRILENNELPQLFPHLALSTQSANERMAIICSVLPAKMESMGIIGWISQRTVDAHDEINPRNVLTLLRSARSAQLKICDRDDPEVPRFGPLLSRDSIREGWRDLSTTRLADTVYAEFQHVRESVEKLRGRAFQFSRAELAKAVQLDPESREFSEAVKELRYSGFLRESANGKLSVPLLYRGALNMASKRLSAEELAEAESSGVRLRPSPRKSSTSSGTKEKSKQPKMGPKRAEELRALGRTTAETVHSSGQAVRIPDLQTTERRALYEGIASAGSFAYTLEKWSHKSATVIVHPPPGPPGARPITSERSTKGERVKSSEDSPS